MPESSGVIVSVRRISPRKGRCCFGYYDVPAADGAGRHLCHRVQFRDRFPTPADVAALGWVKLPRRGEALPCEPCFEQFAETRAGS